MQSTPSIPQGNTIDPKAETRRRRSTLILTVVAALTVLIPFLFWKQTWFGQQVTDDQISGLISDSEKPRGIQQALVQIEERIERGDPAAEQWYPQMAALKDSPVTELRVTLAWVLGSDNRSDLFHRALLEMLQDENLLVRRNAALSLVRFGDDSGHTEIVRMLEPASVVAEEDGLLQFRSREGDPVEMNTLLARITQADGSIIDMRSPQPGIVADLAAGDGTLVQRGQPLLTLGPAEAHAWEALRALLLIGRLEDLPLVESFRNDSGVKSSQQIREQASLTAAEIRRRADLHP